MNLPECRAFVKKGGENKFNLPFSEGDVMVPSEKCHCVFSASCLKIVSPLFLSLGIRVCGGVVEHYHTVDQNLTFFMKFKKFL